MAGFKKEKVAVYIRLANEDQDILAHHIKTMKKYVDDHPGWELVSVYCDIANSARLSKRVGLAKLIQGARQGKFTVVAIPTPSMLSRSTLPNHQLLTKLEEAGATINYADGTEVQQLKFLMKIMKAMRGE